MLLSLTKRAISSVGRAPPLQGGGHWFETGIAHHFSKVFFPLKLSHYLNAFLMWAISSVGRAPPLQGGGHWFETGIAHHLILVFK